MSLWHFVVREQVLAQTWRTGDARGGSRTTARARGVSAAPGLVNPPQPPGAAVVSLACLVEVRTAGVLLSARLVCGCRGKRRLGATRPRGCRALPSHFPRCSLGAFRTSRFCAPFRAAACEMMWSCARGRPRKLSGRCLACFRVWQVWVSARSDAS